MRGGPQLPLHSADPRVPRRHLPNGSGITNLRHVIHTLNSIGASLVRYAPLLNLQPPNSAQSKHSLLSHPPSVRTAQAKENAISSTKSSRYTASLVITSTARTTSARSAGPCESVQILNQVYAPRASISRVETMNQGRMHVRNVKSCTFAIMRVTHWRERCATVMTLKRICCQASTGFRLLTTRSVSIAWTIKISSIRGRFALFRAPISRTS